MSTNIPRIALAPGLTISRILTGLWQIADMEREGKSLDLEKAASSMQAYVDAGLTSFDMADHYGSAELITGIYQKETGPDSKVQLFTKWVPEPGPSSRDKVREAIQRSLDRLQMESLDLLQYHAWNYADPAFLDDLFFLQELKEEGLIQHLGLTNVDAQHLNILLESGIDIVSNQICYSLLDQRAAGAMTRLCEKKGIKLLAFGTLAGGFFTEKWLGKKDPPIDQLATWSHMKYKRFIEEAGGWDLFQNLLALLSKIAKKHHVGIPHIASRYMLEQPAVAGVIVGARLGENKWLASTLQTFDFSFDAEDLSQIQEALALLTPIPGNCGDEYRKPPFLTASGDLSHHLESFPAPYPVQEIHEGRSKALSGTIWEDLAGFSRATRTGNRILVSGTTATHGDKVIGGNDPAAQTLFILDKIEGAIQSLGGRMEDVVRTRIYIRNMEDWEAVSRIHGARFRYIQPANTLIRADIIGEEYLVEIEAEAEVY